MRTFGMRPDGVATQEKEQVWAVRTMELGIMVYRTRWNVVGNDYYIKNWKIV